jgi:hypothetical protein
VIVSLRRVFGDSDNFQVDRGRVLVRALASLAAFLAVVLAVTSLLVAVAAQGRANERSRCTQRWAAQFATRYERVLAVSNARNDALDVFVVSLASKNRDAELAAYRAYLKASAEYRQAQQTNPLPEPPQYIC